MFFNKFILFSPCSAGLGPVVFGQAGTPSLRCWTALPVPHNLQYDIAEP